MGLRKEHGGIRKERLGLVFSVKRPGNCKKNPHARENPLKKVRSKKEKGGEHALWGLSKKKEKT